MTELLIKSILASPYRQFRSGGYRVNLTTIRRVDVEEEGQLLVRLDEHIFLPADRFLLEDWKDYECYVLEVESIGMIGSCAVRRDSTLADDEDEFVCASGTLFCGSIGVLPQYQRQGFGLLLKAWTIAYAHSLKCVRVVSNMRESNGASIGLSSRFGFHVTRRIPDFYEDPVETAVVMELVLTSAP
ncbi:MAG: GNAT family N-acetyltransferase [bacterium]|nr:GNAT family N-acetyltransferase [bacterium]